MTRARELAAKLLPHTTSVHNVALIEAALSRERAEGFAAGIEAAAVVADNLYARRQGGPPTSSREQNGYVTAMREVVPAIRALAPKLKPAHGPEVALARLFRNIWTGGYDAVLHPFDQMVSAGLLEITEMGSPDWGYQITDAGRAALALAAKSK